MGKTTLTITPHADGWVDQDISATADIAASKFQHRYTTCVEVVAAATTVTAKTVLASMLSGVSSGTLQDFECAVVTAPTGGDLAFQVDLQKSTGGGAFATVLSSTVSFSSSDSDRDVKSGTISDSTLADKDILQIVTTVSGSTGTQGLGLLCGICIDSKP